MLGNTSSESNPFVKQQTDWDHYHAAPFPASRITRRFLLAWLVTRIRCAFPSASRPLTFLELGGGNSSFFEGIAGAFPVGMYSVADANANSLRLFERRAAARGVPARTLEIDLLQEEIPRAWRGADIVLSTGLVEHFDPQGTARVLEAHFLCSASPGSLVLVTAPTPTLLYRLVRRCAERLGCWAFPDERPLPPREVFDATPPTHTLVASGILWPTILTQHAFAWQRDEQTMAPRAAAGGGCRFRGSGCGSRRAGGGW
jgi:hypothetical protein